MMKDLNELSKQCHQAAVEKGFYTPPQSDLMILLLIIGEWFEVLESHRKGNFSQIDRFKEEIFDKEIYPNTDVNDKFIRLYKDFIKDSFSDEIADTLIRLLDFAGYKDIEIEIGKLIINRKLDFPNLFHIVESQLHDLTIISYLSQDYKICRCIETILFFCEAYEIDIFWHVDQKLKYNQSRPYKHGKTY